VSKDRNKRLRELGDMHGKCSLGTRAWAEAELERLDFELSRVTDLLIKRDAEIERLEGELGDKFKDCCDLAGDLKTALAALDGRSKRCERLEGALHRIENWCKAYPRTVFIEPTEEQWRTADATLDAHKGDNCPSLTAISGSNMRHVVEGIQKIITEALDKEQT